MDAAFAALGSRHRRTMVRALGLQPWAIHQLAEMCGLSLPAVHRHVTVLEESGLVRRRKRGRTTYLTLTPGPLAQLQQWFAEFHPHWSGQDATYTNYRHLDEEPVDPPTTEETR